MTTTWTEAAEFASRIVDESRNPDPSKVLFSVLWKLGQRAADEQARGEGPESLNSGKDD